MKNSGDSAEKRNGEDSALRKAGVVFQKIRHVLYQIGLWIYRLRRVLLAIPVVVAAIRIAGMNMERLPEMVGLNLQSTGEFAQMVTREYAVYGPLGVTMLCLLLMFFSRKVLYPWIISIFTLVLPYLIYLTNIYPA
ncbi:MAG: hypothetical protein IJ375_04515 [Oscillospiraceae bacterium]|nr:hypothetical protein [Oscillospiraceae bacterium]